MQHDMHTSTTKIAATAFLGSTKSPTRALLLSYVSDYTSYKRGGIVNQFNVKERMVRCFSSSPKSNNVDDSMGSSRGRNAVKLLPTYLSDARAVETYHADKCPNGALQLSVAENNMLEDLLVPSYSKFSVGLTYDEDIKSKSDLLSSHFNPDQIYYQPTHGRPDLRRNMAIFLKKMLKLPKSANFCEENLIMGAGCNAVLENLVFCLAEHGDAVLVPIPYYAAFEFDLGARAGLEIIPVKNEESYHNDSNVPSTNQSPECSIIEETYYPTPKSLDVAYAAALKQTGKKPRILLISHPNNPLGICYPEEVLSNCISWARENKVHLISDEIYAGSVYKPSNFQSALTLASEKNSAGEDSLGLGPYIHFVYALSKDFASSGLRVGVAYTENESIVFPLQKLNDLCQISSHTQRLVEKMLSSEPSKDWAMPFLEENQSRIRNRSNILTQCLDQLDVPYLEPDSGLFLWIDLSQFLPDSSQIDKQERSLYLELMHEYGLLFTPGLSMSNSKPGFFRCVFTAATDSEFTLTLERLQKFVHSKRNEK